MSNTLLPARFLFRFAANCLPSPAAWSPQGIDLDESFRLPSFDELEGGRPFADVRAAWCRDGLVFCAKVEGKRQAPWCRENRLEDSDAWQLWIDTRDTHNIHRAGRFCHRFIALAAGGGRQFDQPLAEQLLIDRARENANAVRSGVLRVHCARRVDGYRLSLFIPAAALTGYDPDEHPRLGFTYALVDRELGEQTFSVGSEFPFQSDPSLWGTLELVRA